VNIQTEHLEEDHLARLTVEVEPAQVQKAFEGAAKRLSAKANIPGFRKGKAPYSVVMRYFGTQGLLEESIESIADAAYKQALDETKISAYEAGSLDDIKLDEAEGEQTPKLKLVFTVPKQPDVILNDYRDLRLDYEAPQVTDAEVERAILSVRENRATIEPSVYPVQMGDKVKVVVKGTIQHKHSDYDLTDEQIESDQAAASHIDEEPINEDQEIILRTGADDDIMPGFSEQLVGMSSGETKEFTLEYPDDSEFDEWANHTAMLTATVSDVRSVNLPAFDDAFVALVTDGKIATVDEYRASLRTDLQAEVTRAYDTEYADEALSALTDDADMAYPEVMVGEYLDDIIKELSNNLRERGMSLEQFMGIEKLTLETLRSNYRDLAIRRLERSLALGKLVDMEKLTVNDDDVDSAINGMVANLGEQAETFRKLFDNDNSRTNIALDIIKDRALGRIVRIARGENPPLPVASGTLMLPNPDADESPAELAVGATEEAQAE